jgi:uncharacterized protein (TIGR02118 family)
MFTVYAMIKRKRGTSREDLVDYYETHHAPLATGHLPGLRKYVRHYLRPWDGDAHRAGSEAPFDVVTELGFDDRASFDRAMAHLSEPDVARLITEDEERVFDRSTITFLTVEDRETDPADLLP